MLTRSPSRTNGKISIYQHAGYATATERARALKAEFDATQREITLEYNGSRTPKNIAPIAQALADGRAWDEVSEAQEGIAERVNRREELARKVNALAKAREIADRRVEDLLGTASSELLSQHNARAEYVELVRTMVQTAYAFAKAQKAEEVFRANLMEGGISFTPVIYPAAMRMQLGSPDDFGSIFGEWASGIKREFPELKGEF